MVKRKTSGTKKPSKPLKATVGKQERSPLDEPPCIALVGPSGRGKTTETFRAFPRARWFTTSNTVLGRPAHMAELYEDFPSIDIDRVSTLEDGLNPLSKKTRKQLGLQPWDEWFMDKHESLAKAANKKRAAGEAPPMYVLDDGGVFFRWWWRDLCARVPPGQGWGKPSPYEQSLQLIDALVYSAKRGPFGFVWTFHKAEAVYYPDDFKDQEKAGTLKYPAGMELPYGKLIKAIGASVDMVVELDYDDDGDLALSVIGDDETFAKVRREVDPTPYKLTEGRTLRTFLIENRFNLEG